MASGGGKGGGSGDSGGAVNLKNDLVRIVYGYGDAKEPVKVRLLLKWIRWGWAVGWVGGRWIDAGAGVGSGGMDSMECVLRRPPLRAHLLTLADGMREPAPLPYQLPP